MLSDYGFVLGKFASQFKHVLSSDDMLQLAADLEGQSSPAHGVPLRRATRLPSQTAQPAAAAADEPAAPCNGGWLRQRQAQRVKWRPPRSGTKVSVRYNTGSAGGTVFYVEGSQMWVAYPQALDHPPTVEYVEGRVSDAHRHNLEILVKPGPPADYRLSRAQLRRLAVTGGIVEAGLPVATAYFQVVWHEPVDWSVRKERNTVTIVDGSDDDEDYSASESEDSEDETAAARSIRRRGVPVDPDDPVLQHLKRLSDSSAAAGDDTARSCEPPFCIFENVVRLASQDGGEAANNIAKRPVCKQLGLQVYSFDSGAAGLSEALRNRLYWSNIPVGQIGSDSVAGATTDLLEGKPSFDKREHLNCLTSKEGTDVMNRINEKVLVPHYNECMARNQLTEPPLSSNDWKKIKQNNLVFKQKKNGTWHLRMLDTAERCRVMGFPEDYCESQTTTIAALHLGQSFHVPTIELLLSGLETRLRDGVASGLGTDEDPLVVVSFFDGIGAAWVALLNCLKQWGLSDICVHYVAIEKDEKCRSVLFENFPKDTWGVKPEKGVGDDSGDQPAKVAKCRYHLHQQKVGPDGGPQYTQWGDVLTAEKAIVDLGKHREIASSTGAVARLDKIFLVFNGFPCNNAGGLNQAKGRNGQQRSMEPGAAGPKTGLYYNSERIIEKILHWREAAQQQADGSSTEECADPGTEEDYLEVSDDPFGV